MIRFVYDLGVGHDVSWSHENISVICWDCEDMSQKRFRPAAAHSFQSVTSRYQSRTALVGAVSAGITAGIPWNQITSIRQTALDQEPEPPRAATPPPIRNPMVDRLSTQLGEMAESALPEHRDHRDPSAM